MLLDSYLPNYFVREVNHIAVQTEPADTFRTICDFDIAKVPWIRKLFQIRTVLDHQSPGPFHLTLRDAYQQGGFVLLQEMEGEELVVGAIGKIWRPRILFEKVPPSDFSKFHKEGFGKVAWSLHCQPRLNGGTLVSLEVRVGATDMKSFLKMRAYYSLIGPFSRAIRRSVFAQIGKQLGNEFAEEQVRILPGDQIVQSPVFVAPKQKPSLSGKNFPVGL